MKTMKKLFMAAIAAAFIGTVLSCPNPAGSGGKKTEPDPDNNGNGTKTAVVFDNTKNPFAVSVYSYGTRTDEYKITDVPAGSSSAAIEWAASPDGYTFYLTYQIPLGDDIFIPHIPSPPLNAVTVRVDAGKTTSATIGSLAPSPALITGKVYLLLYNNGDTAFQLGKQGMIIRPEKAFGADGNSAGGSSLVNPGERAWYSVDPGSAATYSIMIGGVQIPFSGNFEAGRGYIFRYTNSGIVLNRDYSLSLEWLLDHGRVVTFDADGGSPATQTRTVTDGVSLGAANMPPEPAKTDYVFGGWYTAPDGVGTEFTASITVIGDITVYAWWIYQYTVTFDADGGSPAAQTRTVTDGTSLGAANMPLEPEKSGCAFGGWYTALNGEGTEFTGATPVNGSMTVYAKWTIIQYTVTFDADGGGMATQDMTVNSGSSVGSSNMPADPAMPLYTFDGWYTAKNGKGTEFTSSTVVSGNMTVYAKWTAMYQSLNDALTWINTNAVEGGAYIITLTNYEIIAPITLSYSGKNVSVTLRGDAEKRTVSLSSNGSLFTVASGVTLTLDNNIVLRGRSDNNASLVSVYGGKLVMNTGSEISGNTSPALGGGVYVNSSGTFTMNGGTISGNTAYSSGGGVFVYDGEFTMNGGTISGNTGGNGGGVSVNGNGMFTMSGGTISGNTSGSSGGGVDVSSGTFTMSGGTISGNTASYGAGGGVCVSSGGTFTMNEGTISGNTASYDYGGGGVYVGSGTFTKQWGGIIYGSNADITLKNIATRGDSYGHAVYVNTWPVKKRNTTAGVGVTLHSSIAGPAGGWE